MLNPVQYVIHVFGGVRATARAIGRSPSAISQWANKRERKAGRIPVSAQGKILEVASARRLKITPRNIICGGRVRKSDVK